MTAHVSVWCAESSSPSEDGVAFSDNNFRERVTKMAATGRKLRSPVGLWTVGECVVWTTSSSEMVKSNGSELYVRSMDASKRSLPRFEDCSEESSLSLGPIPLVQGVQTSTGKGSRFV